MDSNMLAGSKVQESTGKRFVGVLSLVLNEPRLVWNFIRYDISTTIAPNLLFMFAAWRSSGGSVEQLASGLGRGALFFLLYVLTFCLSNQFMGVEEDRINKPDRPLVRGDTTVLGAQVRWVFYMVMFSMVGWKLGVFYWALLWQVVTCLHNVLRWARHWFIKDLSMCLGIIAALVPAWQLMTPMTPEAWRWILTLGLSVFVLAPTQDLRDMEGDRISQRRTFPLVIGEKPARVFLSVGFVVLAFVTHFLLMREGFARWEVKLCDVALTGVCALIAWRLLRKVTPRDDHHTYLYFTGWYCLVLMSAAVVL